MVGTGCTQASISLWERDAIEHGGNQDVGMELEGTGCS